MKIVTDQPKAEVKSLQDLEVGKFFRFAKPSRTIEEDIVNGDIYLKINNYRGDVGSGLTKKSTYIKLSGDYEVLQRTGPLLVTEIFAELDIVDDEMFESTLELTSPGEVVCFDENINNELFIVITDPADDKKMVTLLTIDKTVIKLSKESSCYVLSGIIKLF